METLNVAVTGYYGTGSSAVTDLIREYDCADVVPYEDKNYEHVVFYVSGGLFNLCTLLTHGNTPFTSDMVINKFIESMERLNKYDFVWFGSYEKLFGNKFKELYLSLINNLSRHTRGKNSNHIVKSRYSLIKAMLQFAAHLIYKRNFVKYGNKYIFDNNEIYFSMPTAEEVYEAAKKFTNGYFRLFNKNNKSIKVYDHLIWANQIDEYARCFDDNFKVIVVDRDPRDVYLLNKYIWFTPPLGRGKPHFPTSVEAFIDEWKKTVVRSFSNRNTKQIHFENLIYDYDNTVSEIEYFVGLSQDLHNYRGKYLNIVRSIENTQIFNVKEEWMREIELIENELTEYLYDYPYSRKPNLKDMFDDPRTISNNKKKIIK